MDTTVDSGIKNMGKIVEKPEKCAEGESEAEGLSEGRPEGEFPRGDFFQISPKASVF